MVLPFLFALSLLVAGEPEEFWSFQPPREPALPAVRLEGGAKTPIDRFILKKLEDNGILPVDAADKRTLIEGFA